MIFIPEVDQQLQNALRCVPKLFLTRDVREVLLAELQLLNATSPLLVCDINTYKALGEKLATALDVKPIILPREVTPAFDVVWNIKQHAAEADVLIAVGSGTINDICKLAAFELDKPYISCPTAPSMNGYVSANASILVGTHKVSFKARAPSAVLADIEVLAQAPVRLIHAGLGDTLARSTAQADWLLSHLLFDTTYDATLFTMLAPYEQELLQNTGNLARYDEASIALLFQCLLLSGFGMSIAGSSAPASQGEHMIAHTMEMRHFDTLLPTFHGEQIGITTLTMAGLQETILKQKPVLTLSENYADVIRDYFGPDLATALIAEYEQKHIHQPAYVQAANDRIAHDWENICAQIKAVTHSASSIRKALENAGAPTSVHDLGWDYNDYQQAVPHAKYSRNRFTFLDLAS